jgi:hypothetical protein
MSSIKSRREAVLGITGFVALFPVLSQAKAKNMNTVSSSAKPVPYTCNPDVLF